MSMQVYIANLSYDLNEKALKAHFARFGEITSAVIIRDRSTQRSKGFGFVTFALPEAAEQAVQTLNDTLLEGRSLKVNIARPLINCGAGSLVKAVRSQAPDP